jgi:hypothetical protein
MYMEDQLGNNYYQINIITLVYIHIFVKQIDYDCQTVQRFHLINSTNR